MLANSAPKTSDSLPLVVYLNHSSWWDPLLCLFLARRFFPNRQAYGPIDGEALQRYQFLPVGSGSSGWIMSPPPAAENFSAPRPRFCDPPGTRSGSRPQGQFTDFHARPVQLQRGLSHLTNLAPQVAFVPLALQYVFWEERLPEIVVGFGDQIIFDSEQVMSPVDATKLFESGLASVQDHLSAASARRAADEWRILLSGGGGVNRIYDGWRRWKARWRGEKFDPAHSQL